MKISHWNFISRRPHCRSPIEITNDVSPKRKFIYALHVCKFAFRIIMLLNCHEAIEEN